MQTSFMITNGGPHPADKWADTTTAAIVNLVQVKDDSVSPEAAAARQAKRELSAKLFPIFNDHHDRVQKHERGQLAKAKASTVANPLDVTPHLTVTEQVEQVLAATPFADHFAKPEVKEVIHQIIGQHTADSMHIERLWHADSISNKGA